MTKGSTSKQVDFDFVNYKSVFPLPVSLKLPYFTNEEIYSNTIKK